MPVFLALLKKRLVRTDEYTSDPLSPKDRAACEEFWSQHTLFRKLKVLTLVNGVPTKRPKLTALIEEDALVLDTTKALFSTRIFVAKIPDIVVVDALKLNALCPP
jgi:hypothetical protein